MWGLESVYDPNQGKDWQWYCFNKKTIKQQFSREEHDDWPAILRSLLLAVFRCMPLGDVTENWGEGDLHLGDSAAALSHREVMFPCLYGLLVIFMVVHMDSARFMERPIQIQFAQNLWKYQKLIPVFDKFIPASLLFCKPNFCLHDPYSLTYFPTSKRVPE